MHFRISSCSKNFKNAVFSIDKFSYQIIARNFRVILIKTKFIELSSIIL